MIQVHQITRYVDDPELKDIFGYLDKKTKLEVTHSLFQLNRNVSLAIPVIDVKIISSFRSYQNNVVTKGTDQALLWNCGERGISLVTSDGIVIRIINTDFNVFDAAVSTFGDLFVTEHSSNKVKTITRDNRITDIYTARNDCETREITVTDTGNVLVVLYKYDDSKIVEITTSGQYIRTIQYDPVDNKQLFDQPLFVCTNINGDIIVTDGDKVVVVNEPGQKRFIYEANCILLEDLFCPEYTLTDKLGHSINSDYWNSAIHVLDRDGTFIEYLMTPDHGCESPIGLDLGNHGRLWVCNTGKETIDILKYL